MLFKSVGSATRDGSHTGSSDESRDKHLPQPLLRRWKETLTGVLADRLETFFVWNLRVTFLLQKKSIDLERNLGFGDIICGTASSFV